MAENFEMTYPKTDSVGHELIKYPREGRFTGERYGFEEVKLMQLPVTIVERLKDAHERGRLAESLSFHADSLESLALTDAAHVQAIRALIPRVQNNHHFNATILAEAVAVIGQMRPEEVAQ